MHRLTYSFQYGHSGTMFSSASPSVPSDPPDRTKKRNRHKSSQQWKKARERKEAARPDGNTRVTIPAQLSIKTDRWLRKIHPLLIVRLRSPSSIWDQHDGQADHSQAKTREWMVRSADHYLSTYRIDPPNTAFAIKTPRHNSSQWYPKYLVVHIPDAFTTYARDKIWAAWDDVKAVSPESLRLCFKANGRPMSNRLSPKERLDISLRTNTRITLYSLKSFISSNGVARQRTSVSLQRLIKREG
jgi:hypothetical protein